MHDWRAFVRSKLPPLSVSPERENEIVAELSLQLEQSYTDARAAGLSSAEALLRAEAQLGGWRRLAAEIDQAERPAPAPENPARWYSAWRADLRYALRILRRSPAYAAIATLTLAFGIGGNTAIFTLVDAIALRSLPYRDPARLVAIETRKTQQPEIEPWTSALDLADIRARAHSFSAVSGISPIWSVVLTGRGPAERLETLYVSAGLFDMLGVKPILGRAFQPAEDSGAVVPVAILSYSLWQRRFAGRSDVLGQVLALDAGAYTVVGVMPRDFRYAGEPVAGTSSDIQLWMPLSANPLARSGRSLRFLKAAGRLAPGVSVAQARDEVSRIGAALAAENPATNHGFVCSVQSLGQQVTGRYRVAMLLLLGTVGFVLLMACASVANLILGRATARSREIGVRAALGASRFRLVRQLLTEGAVLAVAGGLAGTALAAVALRLLVRLGPAALVRTHPIQLDLRALAWTGATVVLCSLLAGLPPALRLSRGQLASALRESARGLTPGNRTLRSALVVAQIAAALNLLVGAGLLIRSFQRLLAVDPGFDPRNVVTVTTLLPATTRTAAQATSLYRRMEANLETIPGVSAVAAVSRLPLLGSNLGAWIFREGHIVPGEPGIDTEYRVATPNYFSVMRIPLRAGRLFDDHDDPACCAVINEAAVRRIFAGDDPIGARVKIGTSSPAGPWVTIVGVIGNVRHSGLDVEPRPEIYRPYAQNPLGNPILVIRTSTDPAPLASTLAAQVRVDPAMPSYNLFLMETLVERSTVERRFIMLLLSGFAIAALLLAGVGVYGTAAQAVTQRTPEIGLRMALGASPASALLLVLRDGIKMMTVGLALGAASAALLSRFARSVLFEVRPLDAVSFAAALCVLAASALLACYIPALRATRIDPIAALRQE